jgi:hypothetical protein
MPLRRLGYAPRPGVGDPGVQGCADPLDLLTVKVAPLVGSHGLLVLGHAGTFPQHTVRLSAVPRQRMTQQL